MFTLEIYVSALCKCPGKIGQGTWKLLEFWDSDRVGTLFNAVM